MNSPRQKADGGSPLSTVDGVFVVGMASSGVELLAEALELLGLRTLGDSGAGQWDATGSFNRRLLAAAGGPEEDPPRPVPAEVARALAPWVDDARKKVAPSLHAGGPSHSGGAWVWGDPDLSILATFWAQSAGVHPALIFVHRSPDRVVDAEEVSDTSSVLERWSRYNKSALVLCSQYPSFVVGYEDFVAQPKAVLTQIVDFLGRLGIALPGDVGRAAALTEDAGLAERDVELASPSDAGPGTLHRILCELDGREVRPDEGLTELIARTAAFYDEDYYGTGYDQSGRPYRREEKSWTDFFGTVAASISKTLRPGTVLDVGCAIGLLVEALRERGVDARGIDLSGWAISQVPADLQPYCTQASATEEIDGHFDLITCLEVLEHIPPSLVELVVDNLCRHAQAVLLSSTPDDFDERSHLNVEPSHYWARLFLEHGFVHDVDYDASYVSPHAMLFRRGDVDSGALVVDYERALWRTGSDLRVLRAEEQQLRHDHQALMESAAATAEAREQLYRDARELTLRLQSSERRRAAENLSAYEMVRSYEADQRLLAAMVAFRDAELAAVYDTKLFRYSSKLRAFYAWLRRRQVATGGASVVPPLATGRPADGSYQDWIDLFDTVDVELRRRIEGRVAALTERPTLSVLMPVYNPPVHLLRGAIDSVRGQIYQQWELCIADDCSTDPEVAEVLEEFAARDARISVLRRAQNGHISAASNSALSLATGEWVALLDHDDLLAEHALAFVALALAEHPDAGIVYSDEDKIDERGQRHAPFFKPEFDPLLLLGQNFVSHLSAFRKDLVERVGGYREGYEGSQDWDVTLRVSELLTPDQVVHIPHVLYHWRVHASSTASLVSAKPYAMDAGRRSVLDHLERTGRPAEVVRIGKSGHNRVVWSLPDPAPRVSIVIPTKDGRLLQRCIDSLLSLTTYPDFEVIVVDNSSEAFATLRYLKGMDDRLTVIRDERPFNYAALNNESVRRSSGELVCLLNDDTEVISGNWLTEMVSQVLQPGVGAVGAKLYYDDARIQHAGLVLGVWNVAGHAFRRFDRLEPGYFGNLQLAHRVSAVTAACVVVRREVWDGVGGMDEVHLPIAFNDVDLCLRIREIGWEIVWSPCAELYHHESVTRGPDDTGPRHEDFKQEVAYMEARWGFDVLRNDPYYNPNLSLDAEDYSLAWPPREPLDDRVQTWVRRTELPPD